MIAVALLMLQIAMPSRAEMDAARVLRSARVAKVENYLVSKPRDLAVFSTCSHSKPSFTGIDWYSVFWDCPADVKMPSNGTAFKFQPGSDEIVKVQATNVPVILEGKPHG